MFSLSASVPRVLFARFVLHNQRVGIAIRPRAHLYKTLLSNRSPMITYESQGFIPSEHWFGNVDQFLPFMANSHCLRFVNQLLFDSPADDHAFAAATQKRRYK